jgi:hypothetical protein
MFKTPARLVVCTTLLLSMSTPSFAQADRDCSDFGTQREAQEFYERNGPGDPHRLDRDNDGIACETLP